MAKKTDTHLVIVSDGNGTVKKTCSFNDKDVESIQGMVHCIFGAKVLNKMIKEFEELEEIELWTNIDFEMMGVDGEIAIIELSRINEFLKSAFMLRFDSRIDG